jgi:S-formylglutathione hydrolase FrmB
MKRVLWLMTGVVLLGVGQQAHGWILGHFELERMNRRLRGQVVDFTNNHGHDRRIWSAALGEKRDMYVYLPPGFDPAKKYPLAIFLHGAGQDEQFFLRQIVEQFDESIVCGKIPPLILAAPDGTLRGQPKFLHLATFFTNGDKGRFEDYVMQDVWDFLMRNFPIREEREAHGLIGASMGGSAAFTLAIKHRDRVKSAVGFMPVLNLRWVDCHDHYRTPFDPCCWSWRTKPNAMEVIGRPKGSLVVLRFHDLYHDIIGHGPDSIEKLRAFNPIEVMQAYDLKPGELDLFIAYGGQDEFNVPAQVESFLYCARERGVEVGVAFDPRGRHNVESARRLFPEVLQWAAPRIAPYSPN